MDSFMCNIKTVATGGHDETKTNTDQPSNTSTDLLSSAKLVAEAAQSAATNKTDQIDKQKVAGATADLLDSAKEYGKFDESQGVGQYIKQADDYLHKYEKSGATGATPPAEAPLVTEEKKAEAPPGVEEKGGKDESESGIGAGDAIKAAGSFFK
ncbi:hypothetical protein HanRHA438_Chr17g0841481 [Helianthus annuus]|uniref:Nodulin-related protein 1 n=1 Tax=Helianthus annuus TaxID=4232 RepID=A0A251TMD9_HELAN|nr:nodulin-related protein 1 [Helianthus annuus]KAF5757791.1 hypothetical protein HanXRQr2_Chr17g0830881 [Helianthus annuus]KAJ0431121.1 hypothetical protein HanHA300_Chr17g0676821 [Helianthus annuus]KAJ0436247.1 hypothetical protein HanIR_Chr17g0902481 [Helianthus annuus]KAJ0449569.1 hypothetical protein HanHA89_Chr17g0729991 [Helianthus annuus]KAJ0638254.1 hypothetical protein HanOQP8_Chr17g0683201 [Helianthus annuus]